MSLLVHQISDAVEIIQLGMTRLDRVIADQGFISDGSYSDKHLLACEAELRRTANEIAARRKKLRANEPALVAAE